MRCACSGQLSTETSLLARQHSSFSVHVSYLAYGAISRLCANSFPVAISPFVQQAIKTTECESPIGNDAAIQYAHYVPRQGGYVRGVSEWAPADPDANVMICSSLTAPSGIENQIHPTCTTGNCSFPYGDPIMGTSSETNGRSTSLYSTVGMCHICEDITQLAHSDMAGQYVLPNGQRIVTNKSDGFVLNVTTSPDLSWVQHLTSSQLSVASRWSFANLTVLASSTTTPVGQNDAQQNSVIASTCVLYPCLRTYTTSIDNGELLENPVSLALMFPSFSGPEAFEYNGRTNDVSDYANVFLPCNVNGIIYTKDNATMAPDSTQIDICETVSGGDCQKKTITAPEACIYRHSAKFGSAVSQVMQDNYLTGGCNVTSGALNCRTKSSGEGPGRDKFLESLYSKVDVEDPWSGNATTESIDAYFGRFATAMTNGYRTRFGSSEYDADKVRNNVALPAGTASGVVWRTTVCTSVELQWMGLPVAIVGLTASLLGWGLRQSWRARRTQPVWKDSVLPLLFYQELLQPADHLAAEAEPGQVLMEVDDMEKLAKDVSVIFHWPNSILVPES